MEKTPRYTQRERNMVLGFAAQYKDVIENKRTDAESNRKKDEVWREIAKEFNARVYHQRSSKQLRQLYKNMKLLLKKDLCGEGKGSRSFMDLLNTLSQQESVAQYISEQMSPEGYSMRQQKYEDEYDDSKFPSSNFDGMDTDVIVIKSEDISDTEQSQNGGNGDEMDEDDDEDCLSPKDMPEVCLEEDDEELSPSDLRQRKDTMNLKLLQQTLNQQQQQHQQQQAQAAAAAQAALQNQTANSNQPEITIQNVGGIRVGSIGSMANLKALQNGIQNSAISITPQAANNVSSSNSNSARQTSVEQQLLLSGLGLSAVPRVPTPQEPPLSSVLRSAEAASSMPTLQRGGGGSANTAATAAVSTTSGNPNNHSQSHNHNNGSSSAHNNHQSSSGSNGFNVESIFNHLNGLTSSHHHSPSSYGRQSRGSHRQDILTTLAIEERKRKIDLLNAQIDYWKTMTKRINSNELNPNPACMCHFPGKLNGVHTPTNGS